MYNHVAILSKECAISDKNNLRDEVVHVTMIIELKVITGKLNFHENSCNDFKY